MYTHDPNLLLSFVYFDQTHCGFLLEKDVEEIFFTLGLMLSRAQVRKLIQKVCKREMFCYRKLTDRPLDGEKIVKTDSQKINLEDLAAGNKKYIPSLKSVCNENIKDEENSSNASLVSYNGAFVDIGKLMEQLDKSERARFEADDKLKMLQQQLGKHDSYFLLNGWCESTYGFKINPSEKFIKTEQKH
nr:cell division cycle and apoptosis regulator protein 1 [Parasteatoda tepidariorum]